jgi:NADPH2:quinone reductase
MDAAVLEELGAPRFGEFAEPVADAGQAVVDVALAGINPVDLATAAGRYGPVAPTFPSVAGREGVGSVDGRRVYFGSAIAPYGSMAQRALVAPEALFDVPDGLDDDVAVALGIAGLAAWLPLAWRAKLQPGETVLVLGATGTVGTIAVQVAKVLGAGRVVAAGRDAAALERARERGADAIVDLGAAADDDDPDERIARLTAAIRDAAGGAVDVTLDPLWGEPALAALGAAAPYARHLEVGQSAGHAITLTADFRQRSISILGYTSRLVPLDEQRAAYQRLAAHALAGEIAVDVERIPLRDVADAWERQARSPRRKLVLVP